MSTSGTRTVGFTTTNWTRAQQYTIRVEQNFGGSTGYKSDEVTVTVAKGAVTIVAAGDQSYYLGEEVQFYRYQHRIPDHVSVHFRSEPGSVRCSNGTR